MTVEEAARAACASFRSAPGGGWPWCDGCGTRADLHPRSGAVGDAVARIVARGREPGST